MEIWEAALEGLVMGFVICILIGPVFFKLIETSIEKGFKVGVIFALGIVVSDSSYFVLAYIVLSSFHLSDKFNLMMHGGGGVFITIFGITLIASKLKMIRKPEAIDAGSMVAGFIRGFLLNAMNPSVLLFWFVSVTTQTGRYGNRPELMFAYFITTMFTIFSTDLLKSFLANRLKNSITPQIMQFLNRFGGVCLVIVGIKFIIDYFIKIKSM